MSPSEIVDNLSEKLAEFIRNNSKIIKNHYADELDTPDKGQIKNFIFDWILNNKVNING